MGKLSIVWSDRSNQSSLKKGSERRIPQTEKSSLELRHDIFLSVECYYHGICKLTRQIFRY